jgi:hypothetical protein
MKTIVILVAAVLLTLEWPAPASQGRTPAFTLGVLRRDGLVVPFAAFDGRRWKMPWPVDIRNRELPISIDDVPESWWGIEPVPGKTLPVWRDGARTGDVTLTGVTTTPLMCAPRFTLKSDYRPAAPPPPPFERPYPKDGLVVGGSVAIERIESVEKGTADWNRLLILLTGDFNQQENRAAGAFTSWRHPLKEEQRKRIQITLEAVYRAPTADPGWTAHYVEAVRQYPPGPDDKDGCGLATFAQGWIMLGPKDDVKGKLTAQITYCDRKGVSYMLPLGLVRANGDLFWVFQFSGFEEEWYEVVEPTRNGVKSRVAYPAGGCPF